MPYRNFEAMTKKQRPLLLISAFHLTNPLEIDFLSFIRSPSGVVGKAGPVRGGNFYTGAAVAGSNPAQTGWQKLKMTTWDHLYLRRVGSFSTASKGGPAPGGEAPRPPGKICKFLLAEPPKTRPIVS